MTNMLLRISFYYFVTLLLSVNLSNNLIWCDDSSSNASNNNYRQNGHPLQPHNTIGDERSAADMPLVHNSADVIMREDAEEIFYNLDVGKYEDEGIRCEEALSPENGYLVGAEDSRVGSVVYVKCDQGFWLSGPVVMACTVDNGLARWTPDTDRTCIKGQTFFNENDPIEPSEGTQPVSTPREDEETLSDEESLPPFIHRNHKWVPSLLELRQKKKQEDDAREERTGVDRLRGELSDRLPGMCLTGPAVGPCHGTFRRYYFDQQTLECRKFYYGGCGGNGNNFESIGDCMSVCKGHSILQDVGGRQ